MDELWIILDAQIDLLLPRQPPASSAPQLNSPLIDFGTVNKLCQCIRTKYRDSIYDHLLSRIVRVLMSTPPHSGVISL
jgi:hypothetical protein